jgi:hypothetical protein
MVRVGACCATLIVACMFHGASKSMLQIVIDHDGFETIEFSRKRCLGLETRIL